MDNLKIINEMEITNWRRSKFDHLKCTMYINQLNEKIELYNRHLDVLDHKELKELKKLEMEKSKLLVVGITRSGKARHI